MRSLVLLLIPVACYFVVEQAYGYFWGLVAGVALSVVSEVIGRLRGEGIGWKATITDICVILLFGAGDIIVEKVAPAASAVISSATLCILIAVGLTDKGSKFWLGMMERTRPGMSENPFMVSLLRQSMKRMLLWALIATAVYGISMAEAEEQVAQWQWVDNYFLLTLLLSYLASEIIISRVRKAKYKNVEWVPLITEGGRIVGGAPRPLVHNGSHWLHPVVHLHVINAKGQLLLQLRPKSKKIQPGRWDTGVGGHISLGENLVDALKRETLEEIGLTNFEAQLTRRYVWKCEAENEYVFVFTTKSEGPFKPKNVDEVDDLKFWSANELEAQMGTGVLTPNIERELSEGLLDKLKKLK